MMDPRHSDRSPPPEAPSAVPPSLVRPPGPRRAAVIFWIVFHVGALALLIASVDFPGDGGRTWIVGSWLGISALALACGVRRRALHREGRESARAARGADSPPRRVGRARPLDPATGPNPGRIPRWDPMATFSGRLRWGHRGGIGGMGWRDLPWVVLSAGIVLGAFFLAANSDAAWFLPILLGVSALLVTIVVTLRRTILRRRLDRLRDERAARHRDASLNPDGTSRDGS